MVELQMGMVNIIVVIVDHYAHCAHDGLRNKRCHKEDVSQGYGGGHSASEMMGTSTIAFLTLYLNIKDFS